jgi:hypothetical protein
LVYTLVLSSDDRGELRSIVGVYFPRAMRRGTGTAA